jgi:V/A-type H+/Na+-transporting ATPase subunit K
MEQNVLIHLKDIGMAGSLAFAAIGSALGTGAAGMAAVGAWKKCFAQNKPAPYILTVFVGAPLSQVFYGLIVMLTIINAIDQGTYLWATGVLGGIAMGMSAWMQGKAGAAAADSLAETGKGFGYYLIVIGIIETIAIFVMAFIFVFAKQVVG